MFECPIITPWTICLQFLFRNITPPNFKLVSTSNKLFLYRSVPLMFKQHSTGLIGVTFEFFLILSSRFFCCRIWPSRYFSEIWFFKELSFSHKLLLKFSKHYIFPTQCRRPLILQTMNSVRSNSLRLNKKSFAPFSWKYIVIIKFESAEKNSITFCFLGGKISPTADCKCDLAYFLSFETLRSALGSFSK